VVRSCVNVAQFSRAFVSRKGTSPPSSPHATRVRTQLHPDSWFDARPVAPSVSEVLPFVPRVELSSADALLAFPEVLVPTTPGSRSPAPSVDAARAFVAGSLASLELAPHATAPVIIEAMTNRTTFDLMNSELNFDPSSRALISLIAAVSWWGKREWIRTSAHERERSMAGHLARANCQPEKEGPQSRFLRAIATIRPSMTRGATATSVLVSAVSNRNPPPSRKTGSEANF
jgi:hypothetical protein